MPIVLNPNNINGLVDLSEVINVIPNNWGFFNQMGIFDTERKSLKTIQIAREVYEHGAIPDRNWDERNSASRGPSRGYLTANIPHFPLDDAIYPNDVDAKVAFSEVYAGTNIETVATTRARKVAQLRSNHALTLEIARAKLITTGDVYAPSGTLATSYGPTINWYTEFGVTRTELTMSLNDELVDPQSQVEPIIAAVQDNLQSGQVVDALVCVCSPEFFNALVNHPYIKDTYKYFPQAQGQSILTGRLTANSYGLNANYRQYTLGNITFIEHRGTYLDRVTGVTTRFIPAGDAYAFPIVSGVAMFKTYYAPANRFDTINTVAQEAYFWEYMGEKKDKIELMTESNFMNAVLRPQAVVRVSIAP